MGTAALSKQISEAKSGVGSRSIGAYYLVTILTGAFVLLFHGRFAFAADVFVGIVYLTVTAFLYGLSASKTKRV